MLALQLACAAILLLFAVARVGRDPLPARVLRRLALLAVAAWLGEESCIRLYGFYSYSPAWSLPLDRVPLLIPLIWPVVILSAHDLAGYLLAPRPASPWRIPLLGGAIVLADASLIEPVAVRSGLWTWTAPGLFEVPPIGILGWAFFAVGCIAVFEWSERRPVWTALLVLPAAPLLTHALLVAAWWGALRWVSATIPPWPPVALAWLLSLALGAWVWRAGMRRRVPPLTMGLRVPAAGFFFALLALHGRGAAPLVAYALAFAPPYLALSSWPGREDPLAGPAAPP